MAKKAKNKVSSKIKSSSKKSLKNNKAATKQNLTRKKSIKKTGMKKKAVKRIAKPKSTGTKREVFTKNEIGIEPGPPLLTIPPVEEPAAHEEAIGTVTHYYSQLSVAVVQINKGTLKTGDIIHVKGHTTDLVQGIESMEYEHQAVQEASAGQSVGLKIKDHVREHDIVYLVR